MLVVPKREQLFIRLLALVVCFIIVIVTKEASFVNAQFSLPFLVPNVRNKPQAPNCTGPPTIQNGHVYFIVRRPVTVKNKIFSVNESVYYKCLNGFKLIGNPVVKCLSNGSWSAIPSCDDCSVPSSVEFARSCYDQATVNQSQRCSGPPRLENAYAYITEDSENAATMIGNVGTLLFKPFDSVRYKCAVMHEPVGQPLVICMPNGEWTQCPFCKPILGSLNQYCSSPPVIQNAIAYMTFREREPLLQVNPCGALGGTFHVGETVSYACNDGYALKGRSYIRCLDNNSWTPRPICKVAPNSGGRQLTKPQIYCPMPPRPRPFSYPYMILNNRAINIRTDRCPFAAPSFRSNTTLIFAGGCQVKCLADGRWTTLMPCESKEPAFPAENYCLAPPPYVRNSRAYFTEDYNVTTELFGQGLRNSPIFEEGEAINYICNRNFVMADEKASSVTCLSIGSWSNPTPVCRRVIASGRQTMSSASSERGVCPDKLLPNVTNAEPYWTKNDEFVSLRTSEAKEWFKIGEFVTYSCSCGYFTVGKPQVECLANNSWTQPSFLCVRAEQTSSKGESCSEPPLVSGAQLFVTLQRNETVKVSQWSYDFTWSILCGDIGQVTYICEKGYAMFGTPKIICQPDGTWSTIPRCEQLPQRFHYRCTNPPRVKNSNGYYRWMKGRLTFISLTDNGDETLQLFELYETISYTCKMPGYTMLGSSISECRYNRTWSSMPVCWPNS